MLYFAHSFITSVLKMNLNIIDYIIENKKIIKVFNLLGQESIPEPNTILIFLYSDGSVEKKISVK